MRKIFIFHSHLFSWVSYYLKHPHSGRDKWLMKMIWKRYCVMVRELDTDCGSLITSLIRDCRALLRSAWECAWPELDVTLKITNAVSQSMSPSLYESKLFQVREWESFRFSERSRKVKVKTRLMESGPRWDPHPWWWWLCLLWIPEGWETPHPGR